MPSSPGSHFLTILTLLDQLDPEDYDWMQLPVLLQHPLSLVSTYVLDLTKENIEFSRIVSRFLMDQERAGFFWVNSQKYADLARHILKILSDKWVYNPYTLIRAKLNAWIHSRHFLDVVDIHTVITRQCTAYYEVGKLAFNLLLILLSKIKVLEGSKAHEIAAFLQSPTTLLFDWRWSTRITED